MRIYGIETDDTLKSTAYYGTPEFPFVYYIDDIEKFKGQRLEWHWHDEFEFTIAISGSAYCLIGAEKILLNKGDGLFINSGVIHRFEQNANGILVDIIFSPEFIAPKTSVIYTNYVAPLLNSEPRYLVMSNADNKHEPKLLYNIYETALSQSPMHELELHVQVTLLWKEFFQTAYEHISGGLEQPDKLLQARIHTMLDFIHRNYEQRITLSNVSASANISKSEALRCFHTGVQTTPINYLNDYRLNRAKDRLLTTIESVTTVAFSVGFESSGYFCKMFRKKFGMSPGEFRKRNGL